MPGGPTVRRADAVRVLEPDSALHDGPLTQQQRPDWCTQSDLACEAILAWHEGQDQDSRKDFESRHNIETR